MLDKKPRPPKKLKPAEDLAEYVRQHSIVRGDHEHRAIEASHDPREGEICIDCGKRL